MNALRLGTVAAFVGALVSADAALADPGLYDARDPIPAEAEGAPPARAGIGRDFLRDYRPELVDPDLRLVRGSDPAPNGDPVLPLVLADQ